MQTPSPLQPFLCGRAWCSDHDAACKVTDCHYIIELLHLTPAHAASKLVQIAGNAPGEHDGIKLQDHFLYKAVLQACQELFEGALRAGLCDQRLCKEGDIFSNFKVVSRRLVQECPPRAIYNCLQSMTRHHCLKDAHAFPYKTKAKAAAALKGISIACCICHAAQLVNDFLCSMERNIHHLQSDLALDSDQ